MALAALKSPACLAPRLSIEGDGDGGDGGQRDTAVLLRPPANCERRGWTKKKCSVPSSRDGQGDGPLDEKKAGGRVHLFIF